MARGEPSAPGRKVGNLEIERKDDGVLALSGEVDLSNADQVPDAVAALASPEGDLVLDVSGLRFIDSTGVRLLLTLASDRGQRGGNLVIERPGGVVQRVLGLMGIERAPYLEIRS